MTKPIIVVGSVNMDLVVTAERMPAIGETLIGHRFSTHHGGKGANQAFAAARLGHPVRLCGAVGDDAYGPLLRAGLVAGGVDDSLLNTVPGASGIALITTGAAGENSIVVIPGANASLTPAQLEETQAELRHAGMLLAQLEIPLPCIEWLASFARRHDIPFMLDPAPACALPEHLLAGVTWLTPNQSETAALLGFDPASPQDAAAALRARGARHVVLKLGDQGCFVALESGAELSLAAPRVNALDTTAAGDTFNAAFAVALMRGEGAEDAARFATSAAALSVTKHGAQASMPDAGEVAAFMAGPAAPV
jgi:ribokinase